MRLILEIWRYFLVPKVLSRCSRISVLLIGWLEEFENANVACGGGEKVGQLVRFSWKLVTKVDIQFVIDVFVHYLIPKHVSSYDAVSYPYKFSQFYRKRMSHVPWSLVVQHVTSTISCYLKMCNKISGNVRTSLTGNGCYVLFDVLLCTSTPMRYDCSGAISAVMTDMGR